MNFPIRFVLPTGKKILIMDRLTKGLRAVYQPEGEAGWLWQHNKGGQQDLVTVSLCSRRYFLLGSAAQNSRLHSECMDVIYIFSLFFFLFLIKNFL